VTDDARKTSPRTDENFDVTPADAVQAVQERGRTSTRKAFGTERQHGSMQIGKPRARKRRWHEDAVNVQTTRRVVAGATSPEICVKTPVWRENLGGRG
jgi:hypothetical protein